MNVLICFLLPIGFNFLREAESLGMNYGQLDNNLQPPQKVVDLLKSLKLTKARIYDTNSQVLTAFVTVKNVMLSQLTDPRQALEWVTTHIKPFIPSTRITGIVVGNEVFTGDDTSSLMNYLLPSIFNFHKALVQLGLDQNIHVSTPSSVAVLEALYPPSAGALKSDLMDVMSEFLNYLATTKAPFWINAYPYFAYKDNPSNISSDYVLFNPNAGIVDPYTKLHYDNMLYAMVDVVIFVAARMGFEGLEVRVLETGWSSKGDEDEVAATVETAAAYNRNLLRRHLGNEGTPLRPNEGLEVYLFALFNENLKPGPTSERNYGLFQSDETMVYNVGLGNLLTSSSSVSLTSSATQVAKPGYQNLVYWMFVYLVVIQVLIRISSF